MDFKFCSILAATEGEPLDGTAPEKDSAIFLPAQKGTWHQVSVEEKLREISKNSDLGQAIALFKRPLTLYYAPDVLTGDHIIVCDSSEIKCFSNSGSVIEKEIKYLYAVCADGAKDACCAKFGIPVAKAFSKECEKNQFSLSLEVSHIGGCRFAATAVCFPSGNSYGRILPEHASEIKLSEESSLIVSEVFRGNIFVSEIHCWIMRHSRENFGYVPTPAQTDVIQEGNRFHITITTTQGDVLEFDMLHHEDSFNLFSGCSNINSGRSITRSSYDFIQLPVILK